MESNLLNIKDYETYLDYTELNESLTDGSQNVCNQVFLKSGPITFADGTVVEPRDIIKVVDDAVTYLADQYTRTFRFAKKINIIYLRYSKKIKTMAVDEHLNLYMNAGFIYYSLKMDKMLVAAVIMHEVYHVLFNHIERGKNWLAAKGKTLNIKTHHDNNLAADVEVNQALVKTLVIDADTLQNVIHGLYLKNMSHSGVVAMETILENDEYMEKLRQMSPPPEDPENPVEEQEKEVETSEEWDNGYKEGWNKIAGLIKKYGYKGAYDKLVESGIINGAGEVSPEAGIDDIKGLEFIQVLDESKSEDKYQTYDDGYAAGAGNLISKLMNAMNSAKGGGSVVGSQGGDKIKTNLKDEDLDEVNLPSDGENGEDSNSNGGFPENIKSDNNSKDDSQESDSKSSGQGKGSKNGKSDDDLSDDDYDKLENDLKDKEDNGESKKQEINMKGGDDDTGAIGGTGSFIDSKELGKSDILKESGYDEEAIKEIDEIRKKNAVRNSAEGIQKARRELKSRINSGFMKTLMNKIEIEEEKYKDVWKEIMEKFLSKKTRNAGRDVSTGRNDWIRKKSIANGSYGVHHKMEAQNPQDVNVYVDVSGSMDLELLEIICKSLVVFSQQYEYSGINICPWASTTNGISRVDEFSERDENEITQEILKIISKGESQCGGGTAANAMIAAMLDILGVEEKEDEKDDVHVVITDGQFDYHNIENRMVSLISGEFDASAGVTAVENTFWMIYDAPEYLQEEWKNEIKKGKLIFIVSDTVKGNK